MYPGEENQSRLSYFDILNNAMKNTANNSLTSKSIEGLIVFARLDSSQLLKIESYYRVYAQAGKYQ